MTDCRIAAVALALFSLGCESGVAYQGEPYTLAPLDTAGGEWVDTFQQPQQLVVDVLWVVDSSLSMFDEQLELRRNFSRFARYFEDSASDYRLGVTTVAYDRPEERGRLRTSRGRAWVDNTVDDPIALFRELANVGTDGPTAEKGRAQIFEVLGGRTGDSFRGFLRDEADLVVIVVSDEDDGTSTAEIGLEDFTDWMVGLKGDSDRVTFHSIVAPDGGCPKSEIEAGGYQYMALTQVLGGFVFDICFGNWGTNLDQIGLATSGLQDTFFLTRRPVVDTLEVKTIDVDRERTYALDDEVVYDPDRNALEFVDRLLLPSRDATIEVTYTLARDDDEGPGPSDTASDAGDAP